MTGSASIVDAGSAREARDGEVEAVPEEVYGAGLAVEPAAELLEDRVRPVQDAAEALDRLSIPRRVLDVLGKRRRHRDPERLLLDLDVDAELGEHRVEAGVEVRDGHPVAELERPVAPVAGLHEQGVIEEVESDLEGRPAMTEAPCREPADVDVEGCVPPVVARRRRGEPDLADDLGVEVQGVLRRAPVGEVQLGERHRPLTTNATLSR